jgi:Protein of unknown function (DUF4058)
VTPRASNAKNPRMKNPFPGMNPWLEDFRRDVHAKLLVYACDELNKPVPAGRVHYHICVTRRPRFGRDEFYIAPLRERLPTIRVPLRRTEPDAAMKRAVMVL